MNTSFENLQIGDTVAISSHRIGSEGRRRLVKVTKITKAYFTVTIPSSNSGTAIEYVFNRKTGRLKGADAWNTDSAFIPTEQEIEDITNEQKSRRLRMTASFRLKQMSQFLSTFSDDELTKLNTFLDPFIKKAKSE
jgi:hypothetical protein